MQQQNTFYRKVNVVREGPTASTQATISNLLQLYLFKFSLFFQKSNLWTEPTLLFNIEIKARK